MFIVQSISVRGYFWSAAVVLLFTLSATPALADDLTRPIAASPDGHFLVEPDGQPFFWIADTAWELFHRLNREETEIYLQDRARKGFNVIQAVATGKLDYDGLKAPNRAGDVPFIDADPTRPNPRYFTHLDWVVDRAAHYGIRMAILPIWNTVFGKSGTSQVLDAAKAEEYGRWLGQRYRGEGVIWVLGGDMNPIVQSAPGNPRDRSQRYSSLVDFRPLFDAMANGIVAGEGGNPFITYHPSSDSPGSAAPPRMSLYFGDRDWFDLSMLQSSHAQYSSGEDGGGAYVDGWTFWEAQGRHFVWNAVYNYLPVSDEYRAVPSRPILDGEPRYEAHPIWVDLQMQKKPQARWQPHQVRQGLYQALFAGAAGHTYGHFSVWDFYDPIKRARQGPPGYIDEEFGELMRERPPWQQALLAPAAGQMQHAKALLLSRPYFSRIPEQSLIMGASGEGEQHIGATRDREGSYAMLYLPQGRAVTVDLTKLSGTSAIAWWFDPRNGEATRIEGTLPTNQPQRVTPPTSGVDQDWVLVIDDAAKKYPTPGSSTPVTVDTGATLAHGSDVELMQLGSRVQSSTPAMDQSGTIHLPAFSVPLSSHLSEAAKRSIVAKEELTRDHPAPTGIENGRAWWNDLFLKPQVARLRATFPVVIERTRIGGVSADIIEPKAGVSPAHRDKVLINIHGGGFEEGAGLGGPAESIPISAMGGIKVIAVDYRLSPEYRFPAAVEDVAAVYRQLLNSYQPENIGVYGCSAGGMTSAHLIPFLRAQGLPTPGAIGILCAGAIAGELGDSLYLGSLLDWRVPPVPIPTAERGFPSWPYFGDIPVRDHATSPAYSLETLSHFPATLVISSSRDAQLSDALYTHRQLVKAGVDAELHVWEGLGHGFFAQPWSNIVDPDVPEIREAWEVIVRFFEQTLGAT